MSSSLVLITKKEFNVPYIMNLKYHIHDLPDNFKDEVIYLSSLGQEEFVLNGWFENYNRYSLEQSYIHLFDKYNAIQKGDVLWQEGLNVFLEKLSDYFIVFLKSLLEYGEVYLVSIWQGNKSQYKWDKKLANKMSRTQDDLLFNVVTKIQLSISDLQQHRSFKFIRNNIIEIIK